MTETGAPLIAFPRWPPATPAARAALLRVCDSGQWWQSGDGIAERLEEWLCGFHAVRGAVAVSSGTHALELAVGTLDLHRGDEVLVPATTFISSATAVSRWGAKPVAVDVEADTLCIDVAAAADRISGRTVGVLPVHVAGHPADMDAVTAMADANGLTVIEDAAQANGAEWRGRRIGGWGELAILSFQASKLLPAGEGGAILIRGDLERVRRLELMANCGRARGSQSYEHQLIGSNCRMTEFQAALVLAQAEDYERLHQRRTAAAALLTDRLENEAVRPLELRELATHAWYAFLVRLDPVLARAGDNMDFAAELRSEGIPANHLYPPFQSAPAYQGLSAAPCPEAERAGKEVVVLSQRVLLAGAPGVERVVSTIRRVADRWAHRVGAHA